MPARRVRAETLAVHRARARLIPLAAAALAACGSDPAPVDAGAPDASVDAGFADAAVDAGPRSFTLRLDFAGLGAGRVTSAPAGLDCDEDCEASFLEGTQVILTATTAAPSVFVGWEGAECGASPSCPVTVDADTIVTARFDRTFTLTIEPAGDGLGVVDVEGGPRCFGECEVPVQSDRLVILHARPAAGVEFVGWSGECSGPDPECRVGINADKFVRPLFEVYRPQITGGAAHFCALTREGGVRCWGRGHLGQLGWPDFEAVGDDEAVRSLGNLPVGVEVVQIEAGDGHTCVLDDAGEVRCWGDNRRGQLGRGDQVAVGGAGNPTPAETFAVDLPEAALQVSAGGEHTCAVTVSGAVHCWGRGSEGQLGYGDRVDVGDGQGPSPRAAGAVDLGGPALSVAAGAQHTCAVLVGGDVKCWGSNSRGQLGYAFAGSAGDGTAGRATPAALEALPLGAPVQRLGLGPEFSCAHYEDRRVRCWGANDRGQLGDGSTQQVGGPDGVDLSTGVDVLLGLDLVVYLALGEQHACGSLQNGRVRCWGSGQDGATGQEGTADEGAPPEPILLNAGRPLGMAAAGNTTCVTTRTGNGTLDYGVTCWGDGAFGKLGNGATADVGDRPGSMPPAQSAIF